VEMPSLFSTQKAHYVESTSNFATQSAYCA
jgi:hypothetical protein